MDVDEAMAAEVAEAWTAETLTEAGARSGHTTDQRDIDLANRIRRFRDCVAVVREATGPVHPASAYQVISWAFRLMDGEPGE